MAGPLARLYATLGLDAREFTQGITGAQNTIGGFGTTASAGLRVAGAAVGAGLALAAKGALEMEDRAAQFQAQTGASAEEARHFADELNAMSGRSLVAMDDLAGAMTMIRTDLGLSGAEADAAADQFERYMRATGQGADAVSAYDDILDSWNLTAADTQAIMDTLIAGQQEYGGTLTESQATLAKLAPALQAANMGWEEGAEFINLFNAAGVDAAAAVTGMTKALGEVESPQELQELLEDISATEDPFLRAQKAADLFGVKAGTKLAQALQAADGDLSQFGFTMEEVAGKTEDAAAALDSTLSSKFKLALNHALSLIRGFGMELGPVLTAAFSAVSLGKMLGLDKVLSGVWTKAAAAAGPAISIAGGAASAAYAKGVVLGQKLMAPLVAAWSSIGAVGSRVLAAAFGAGGLTAASYIGGMARGLTVVGIAAIVGEAVNEGLRQAGMEPREWKDIVGTPALRDRVFGDVLDEIEGGTDEMRAEIVTGTWGALSAAEKVAAEGGEGVGNALATALTSGVGGIEGAVSGPIEDEFAAARKAILQGFGSVKAALQKGSRPQLISRDDRLENMAKRQRKVQKQLNAAVAADDPWNQKYWEGAKQKIALQMARLSGDHAAEQRIIQRASGNTANKAIADGQRVLTAYEGMDLSAAGQALMATWAAGISMGMPAALANASLARDLVTQRLNAGPSAPPVGGTGGGSGTTINVSGHVINTGKGYDDLSRNIGRRSGLRSRGPMRYADRP